MHVKKLNIENFRGIRKMELELHPQMNVFIGINGAGKSSVLDALGYLFALPVRVVCDGKYQNPQENCFPDFEIHNDETGALLDLEIARNNKDNLVCTMRSFRTTQHSSNLPLLYFSPHNWELVFIGFEKTNANILVYYRARREVDKVPIAAWTNRNFLREDAFIDALAPKVDFKEFFEWFRNREDLENEERAESQNGPDPTLKSVRKVIGAFCEALKDVRVRRRDPLRMVVTKNNQELRIEQLSDGEKCLLAMVGDLARRMAIANPSLDDPLHGEGIVLIDEVDLHLHPQWQRMILPRLMANFPNCQFIVTTHSPQILGELKSKHVFILSDEEDGIISKRPAYELYGQTSSLLLEDMMQTSERNGKIKTKIKNAFEALEIGSIDDAKRLIGELREEAADIPDLHRLDMRLFREEVADK
jgi:predicted ATP-binding protein involved in virulence